MSISIDRDIPCPHCGAMHRRPIAESVNGARAPEQVQDILEGRFQVFVCAACEQPYEVDLPFVLLDFDRKHWIHMFPSAWETSWRSLERQARETFAATMIQHAPPMVRDMAQEFPVRVVFGLPGLRDKLLCLMHGIDDACLELYKLDMMRSLEGLSLHPACRPQLVRVDDTRIELRVLAAPEDDEPQWSLLYADRDGVDAIERDSAWADMRRRFDDCLYVDVGRILIPGTDPA